MAMLEKEFGHCAIRLDLVSKHRPLEVCVSTALLADNWSPVEGPVNKWCLSKAWSYGKKEVKLDDSGSSRVSEATLTFCVRNWIPGFMKSYFFLLLAVRLIMKNLLTWCLTEKRNPELLFKCRVVKMCVSRNVNLCFTLCWSLYLRQRRMSFQASSRGTRNRFTEMLIYVISTYTFKLQGSISRTPSN